MGSPVYCGRTIPTELCLQIAEHCDRQTLKNLRIVNKATEAWASEELFKEINVAFFEQSFKHIQELSSSVFASKVKRIVVWRGALSPHTTLNDLNCLFDEKSVGPMLGWEVAYPFEEALQAFWQVYSTLQAEQQSILDIAPRDLRLSNAIASLPNLSSVQVQAGIQFDQSGYKPEIRMFQAATKGLRGAELIHQRCLPYFAIDANLLPASSVADHVMRGLSGRRSETLVSTLDMSMAFSLDWDGAFLTSRPAHTRAITISAFASLTKVAINNTFKGAVDRGAEIEILHCLQHCLRLKYLQLYLSTKRALFNPWRDTDVLAELATSTYWPELEVVKLRVMTCTDQLINFLRHHTTITSLSIYSSRLDNVPAFLNQLPTVGLALKQLKLRQLYSASQVIGQPQPVLVWYFFDAEPSQAEKAFLMSGQGIKPTWEAVRLWRRAPAAVQLSVFALPAHQQKNVGSPLLLELSAADEEMLQDRALVMDELCHDTTLCMPHEKTVSLLE